MIVSKEHNFLFLHVPKAGGTSAHDIFKSAIMGNQEFLAVTGSTRVARRGGELEIDLDEADAARMVRLHGRMSSLHEARKLEIPAFLGQIIKKTGCPPPLRKHSEVMPVKAFFSAPFYSACAKAIFVRNPYSRAYSAYKYMLRTERDVPGSRVRDGERVLTIDEFLDEGRCAATPAGRLQAHWYDADAENFHVFRLEDYLNSIQRIIRDLMKVSPGAIRRAGRALATRGRIRANASTSGPDEWKSMSPETRRRIERIYRADFEAFGY